MQSLICSLFINHPGSRGAVENLPVSITVIPDHSSSLTVPQAQTWPPG